MKVCRNCGGIYENDVTIIKGGIVEVCPNCESTKIITIKYEDLTQEEKDSIV